MYISYGWGGLSEKRDVTALRGDRHATIDSPPRFRRILSTDILRRAYRNTITRIRFDAS